MKTTIPIHGMSCAACVAKIEKSLAKVPGVSQATVGLASESATFDAKSEDAIVLAINAVRALGYEVPINRQKSARQSDREQELRKDFYLLVGCAAFSIPLVTPMLVGFVGPQLMLPGLLQLALALPVQVVGGFRFYRGTLFALRAGSATMDVLVALGTSAAFLLSVYLLFQDVAHPGHHLYFESAAVVITLVRAGKWLEARARLKTGEALRALEKLWPQSATLKTADGSLKEANLSEIRTGDTVVVRSGERIGVDGVVSLGSSHIDESFLTGESMPVSKSIGAPVFAGSLVQDGMLEIRSTKEVSETMLSQIISRVEDAQSAKAPIQRVVDRVSAVFVPAVLVIATGVFAYWYFLAHDSTAAILNSVAVLVIACPCALGLATPAALIVGTGLAAARGILIKDAEALELAHRITIVAFDKTGTLTEGTPEVVKLVALKTDEQELLATAAALAQASTHPLSRALLVAAKQQGIDLQIRTNNQEVQAISGKGIVSATHVFGNAAFLAEQGIVTATAARTADELRAQGMSVSFLGQKSPVRQALGLISFQDQIKSTAQEATQRLRRMGIETTLVSGDHRLVVESVAKKLAIDTFHSEVLPNAKAAVVEKLKSQGAVVAMVGDGINDAPALAAADVGIALSTGTDVAMHSAAITLLRGDPRLVATAIEISKATYRKIQQNLFWAFAYNIVGIPLAAAGRLSPMIAGLAMALSSISVLSNALLLKRSVRYK